MISIISKLHSVYQKSLIIMITNETKLLGPNKLTIMHATYQSFSELTELMRIALHMKCANTYKPHLRYSTISQCQLSTTIILTDTNHLMKMEMRVFIIVITCFGLYSDSLHSYVFSLISLSKSNTYN